MIIGLKDFRYHALNNNRRIYYFMNNDIVNLYILVDGMLVKSFINLSDVDNTEKFFSDKMFDGATRLLFNIPLLSEGSVIPGMSPLPVVMDDVIAENKSDETENVDIQKEGVGEE